MTGPGPMPEMVDHRLLRSHAYALVAAEAVDRLPHEMHRMPTAQGVLTDSAALLPVLVPLATSPPATLVALQQMLEDDPGDGAAPLFAALLDSEAAPAALAAHLGRVQVLANRAGERAWLRVHDPRVWLQLQRVLEPAQMSQLCGPVARWTSCLYGQWSTFAHEPVAAARQPTLDDAAWAAIGRIGTVNRVLSRLQPATPAEAQHWSAAIDALVKRAQHIHALHQMEDQIEYACLGMTVHARFDEHPYVCCTVQQAKASALDAEFDLMTTLLNIDQQTWRRVRSELNETTEATLT